MHDFRYALRQLGKRPAFALVVILSLAVGIGANTVVVTWIRATLLDAIPGASQPARLVVVTPRHVTAGISHTMSLPDLRSLSEEGTFAGITASQIGAVPIGTGDRTEWVWAQFTMANFFDVLGVVPRLGRGFQSGEDQPGAAGTAVISHDLWQRRFGGDPSVIGQTLEVNRRTVTIVGVAPAAFHGAMGGLRLQLWVPLSVHHDAPTLARLQESRGNRWLHTVARLRGDQRLRTSQAAAATVASRLAAEFPNTNRDTSFAVMPVWRSPWGGQAVFLPLLTALGWVAALLLVLVIANVANLLLARAQERGQEMAVRLSLGANAARLFRLLLVESLVLALAGGALGTLGAMMGGHFLYSLLPPTYLPIDYDLGLDPRVLGVTAILTLCTGVAFGFAPALHAARVNLNDSLKSGGRGTAGPSAHHWLRKSLVVAEVALALVVLIGMGLCVRSFNKARQLDLGLDPHGVVVAGFKISPYAGSDEDVDRFYQRLRQEAASLPGTESVALADWLPLGFEGGSSSRVEVEGYQPAVGEAVEAGVSLVSPGYFETLRIPVLSGRGFRENDDRQAPMALVINDVFAQRYFGKQDPLGRKVRCWGRDLQVIGVVKSGPYLQLREPPRPYVFLGQLQFTDRDLTVLMRVRGEPKAALAALERLSVSLDPSMRPFAAMSYVDYVGAAFTIPRIAATLLTILGLLALALAVLGIYAVMTQSVGQRRREMGVRTALGATRADLVRLVLREGLRLALVGLGFGLLAGAATGQAVSSLLVGIGAADVVTWMAVPLLLIAAAAAACGLPAWRAARIHPMAVLRSE